MANKQKGEIAITAGQKRYVLCYSVNALCELEGATGKRFVDLAAELSDPARVTIKTVRDFFHSGLLEHQPDISLREAGDLMVQAGGMLAVMTKIGEALDLAFEEAKPGARPPKGAGETGTGSAS